METPKKFLILIVDDVAKNLQVLGSILMKEGYQIAVASNGRQTFAMMDRVLPDLILLDVMMPEMNGFEVCKALKSSENTRQIPIIFLTAKTEPPDIVKGFEYGAIDYIAKPFNIPELLARVKTHLELKQARDIQQELIEKLRRANTAIESANKKMVESIQYARQIQKSLLPNFEEIKTRLPESFVIWMPRDVVGGDMIFSHFSEHGIIEAVIDCTGHGVPGAFMTMIASSGMRKIIIDEKCCEPDHILKKLNFFVKTTLQQDTAYAFSDDGLDAAICFIQFPKGAETANHICPNVLKFAGARMPLIYVHNQEIHVIEGDKQSLGYKRSDLNFNYACHTIAVEKGMSFYMLTDGFTDQLGGPKRLSFGKKRLKNFLLEIYPQPFEKQRELLVQAFNDYKRDNERQDDVTVAGFRCPVM